MGVVGICLSACVLRAWSVSRWSWMDDDWVYMERSHALGVGRFLFQNYNGHVMPLGFAMVWVMAKVAPLSHGAVVAVTVAWSGVTVLSWALALREVCGERLRALVPLLLIALTPLNIQATVWWAAAVQTLALQTTLAVCVYLAARLAREDRRKGSATAVWLVVAYAVGLMTWEKDVLVLLPIVGVLMYLGHGPWRRRLVRLRGTFLALGAVTVGYVAFYVLATRDQSMSLTPVHMELDRSPVDVVQSFWQLLSRLLAPAFLGGPWGTLPTDRHLHDTSPWWFALLTTLAVGCIAVLGLLGRRRVGIVVAMVSVYAALAWGLVVLSSRHDILGLTEVGVERYAIDIFVVACTGLALVLAPEATRCPGQSRVEGVRAAVRRGASSSAAVAGAPRVAVSCVLLLAASLVAADVTATVRLGVSPARAWVSNLTSDIDRRAPVALVDADAPAKVLFTPFWGRATQLSRMLAPLGNHVSFGGPSARLYRVDADGHLRHVELAVASQSRPGPVTDCGYALGPGQVLRVPMSQALYRYTWGVQLDGFSGQAGSVVVEVDGHRLPFRIRRGLNSPQAVVVSQVSDVVLRSTSARGVVCVTDVRVGAIR